ncbi:DUF1671-domain-containing protein [Hypoxylon sp. FL1857]|nr:DUF1671-domain-containing protein [Hypoxylon sp. FL1857]
MSQFPTCPYCGYRAVESTVFAHILLRHRRRRGGEGDEPVLREKAQRSFVEVDELFECGFCGEIAGLSDVVHHMQLHELEMQENEDAKNSSSESGKNSESSNKTSSSSSGFSSLASSQPNLTGADVSPIKNWMKLLNISSSSSSYSSSSSSTGMSDVLLVKKVVRGKAPAGGSKKLGRKDLGAHHREDRMPDWLYEKLKREGFVSSSDTIPVISQLFQLSPTTQYAYFCSPATQRISKLKNEGGFCGYRNIQMLVSYIINTNSPGAAAFGSNIPDIFQIQDLIEDGWESGINRAARDMVGVLRRTRKYIGTAEAQVLFDFLGIDHKEHAYYNNVNGNSRSGETGLYDRIEEYFMTAPGVDMSAKIRNTAKPPIYFQHHGHSMTIIGIERTVKGTRNLLVFDPSYDDPALVKRHIGGIIPGPNNTAVEFYRRGPKYLGKYNQFEILLLL